MAADPSRAPLTTPADSAAKAPELRAEQQSSHVRAKASEDASRAVRRVAEYLRMLGLCDEAHIERVARAVTTPSWNEDAELHANGAMRLLQDRVQAWQAATFGDLPHEPHPTWLRAFLGAHPQALLDEPKSARAIADTFGDPVSGSPPLATPFAKQRFGRPRLPAWLRGLVLPLLTTILATTLFGLQTIRGATGPLEVVWLLLFAGLTGSAALGFFTALRGFRAEGPGEHSDFAGKAPSSLPARQQEESDLPRTAVIVPIYHESAADVLAGIAAMRESLLPIPGATSFEMFVLSDSQDPLIAAEEERALRRITANATPEIPVYYRRRTHNVGQKSGNLAEFFQRFGHRYEYVIVLDADSLMRGETIVELASRIHRAPRVALLQAPIVPTSGQTLLARSLQWSSSVAGPLFGRGLRRWSGPNANYYGHNAILRTRAFLDCCALPALSGRPPLGGPLLSHDFVEAALLCRGGWQVRMATDLTGSYEELPPTLAEYVARDRRWCQGNLQHLRILLSAGLTPMSRLHLLFGALAYLAGPTWVAFTLLGAVLATLGQLDGTAAAGGFAFVLALLIAPRVLGVAAALKDPQRRAEHGGTFRLLSTFFAELPLSAALGPILMVHHTRMVASVVLGRAVTWGAQRRRAVGRFAAPLGSELGTMLFGLGLAAVGALLSTKELLWLAPVWLPLVLSVPIAALFGSRRVGSIFRRLGLLLVPSETHPDPLAERARELRTLTEGDSAGRFRDLVLDPVLMNAHLERLAKAGHPVCEPGTKVGTELRERALRVGPAALGEHERQALLGDPISLRWLHRAAWCHWPTETWKLGRLFPQLPPDHL